MTRTVGELAQYLGAKLTGDADLTISGVASPELAGPFDVIYVDSPRHLEKVAASSAHCVLARPGVRLTEKAIIEVSNPKFAFAKAAQWVLPKVAPQPEIHKTAVIAPSVALGPDISIGPYVVIEDDVKVGTGTVIEAFCFLGRGTRLGNNCHLHPHVTLYPESLLGNRVELHAGVVIGGDGFGYVFGEGQHIKFPQVGTVEIGDDVEIGCNTTIDRGSLDATKLGRGVKIDNLVQVAHNVTVGENSVIVAQTGISGSCTLGSHVLIGGQAGIGDHAVIEDEARVGGQAGVLVGKTIRRGQIVWGTPARPLGKFKQQYAWLARLPELAERIEKLERQNLDRK
jgi:UDP-3-O-[3-hydroxymyristoyl] glucosamine N-acyltransferase